MFAVIMQSNSPYGIRQTAVVPVNDGECRVFTRVGQTRGVAGAWSETKPSGDALNEKLIGNTSAITITASDYRDLQYPITPTTLMQKLVRVTKNIPVVLKDETLGDELDKVCNLANNNPLGLMVYTQNKSPVVAPPVVAPPAIQEVHQPQEPAPAPVVEEVFTQPAVVEPTAPLVESEPVMAMTTSTVSSPALAVIHVPEYEEYYERSWNGLTETEILDYARLNQQAVLATGDAGTGKTSSFRNYAFNRQLPFVTIECTQQIDQSITQGRFVPTGVGNNTKWLYSQLATAIQQPSVILLNELTRMNAKSASLFLRLLQERELLIEPLNEVIKVHPECLIVADQNTGLGYTGTVRQDNALLDRFNVKLEFKYDSRIESKFIPSETLLSFATSIRSAGELSDQFSIPMSTRLLKNFVNHAKNLNFEFAVESLLSSYPKSDGEREGIKMRFDAEYETIASELGVPVGNYSNK